MNKAYEIEKYLDKKRMQRKLIKTTLFVSIITTILGAIYVQTNAGATIGALSLLLVTILIILLKKNKKQIEDAEFKISTIAQINIEIRNNHTYEIDCTETTQNKNQYTARSSYTTECENKFYKILKDNFGNEYEIHPQIPLSSIIEKQKTFDKQYQNELYRVIDFGIFSKDSLKPLLLIEINDKTHKAKERRERDDKVKQICKIANIELITFWTEYPNTEEYIINRIKSVLNHIA